MSTVSKIILYSFSILLFASCNLTKKGNTPSELDALQSIMTGSFNSQLQSEQDSNYYNISLHMYPIWTQSDKHFLYVEQAIFEAQDRPYRQRVYALAKESNGIIESKVYEFNEPETFIGKWADPAFFDSYDESILSERTGCSVFLKKVASQTYEGSTEGKACNSSLRGASYATSVVRINKDKITSWDQGFNSDDKQVWGAVEGPYIFDKLK